MSNRHGYPIIGGPLDGSYAKEADFYEHVVAKQDYVGYKKGDVIRQGGQFADHRQDYIGYNRAGGSGPTRVWLHTSLLP